MTNKVWLLCVALIFGFVLLRSDSSEGRPLDFSPIEYQRKTRAEAEFMVGEKFVLSISRSETFERDLYRVDENTVSFL